MRISRRDFVKSATASGIALSITPLAIAEEPNFAARETLPGRQGWNPAATGAGRLDGVAKVTGAKLYESDFRAADLPNWPQATSHAMLIRAADATHVYDGLDLSHLSGALKPSVAAADLARIGVRVPEFYAGDLLCPVGKTPLYLGQPVALLIFEDFDAFDQARLALRDEAVLALEPESGLAWHDARRQNLELVVSVQSPYEAAGAIAHLLGNAQAAFRPARINTNFASCGGAFGGRDYTPFPLYVALAAMFFPNRPVRLANNRYEQFQSGIKRHAFKIRTRMLKPGGRTMAGNTYSVSIRTPEILDKLEQHPIWKQRADEKARGQQAGLLVGTGVACATKNYGTGGDCSLGSVEIAPDGRITIRCDGVEIGNGIGTAAANRVAAHLGGVADEVALAQFGTFVPLALVTSGDSYSMNQKTQDTAARNPRRQPASTEAGPPIRRCAARWSASRSIGEPARCVSQKHTAFWNAARRWSQRSCWDRCRAASRWVLAMRCSSRCRFTRMDRATGHGTSVNTASHEDRTCRSTGSRSRYCHPLLPTSGRRVWPKAGSFPWSLRFSTPSTMPPVTASNRCR